MCTGPMNAPTAANNFTSPAPVAPIKCPGSISARPSARPASDAPSERPPMPNAAKATPVAANPIVSGFGTRRVHKSIAAPTPVPLTTVAIARKSDGLANLGPEDTGNRVAERRDTDNRREGDQRRQQTVFDQILSVVLEKQPCESCHQARHEKPPFEGEGRVRRAPHLPTTVDCGFRYAAGTTSLAAIELKIVLTLVPARPIETT